MPSPTAGSERPLVLASSSVFRRQLLERLGRAFEIAVPNVDETPRAGESPTELVRRLAQDKAAAVAGAYPSHLVIGSDQVAVLDGRVLGKPGTHERAREQLRAASGRTMQFHTGLCVLDSASGAREVEVVPTRVVFRALDDEQIERYLRQDQPYQCAGSFRSEALGITLFERIEGDDPTALMGLPLMALVRMLARFGVRVP